jgi:hypothetical protein
LAGKSPGVFFSCVLLVAPVKKDRRLQGRPRKNGRRHGKNTSGSFIIIGEQGPRGFPNGNRERTMAITSPKPPDRTKTPPTCMNTWRQKQDEKKSKTRNREYNVRTRARVLASGPPNVVDASLLRNSASHSRCQPEVVVSIQTNRTDALFLVPHNFLYEHTYEPEFFAVASSNPCTTTARSILRPIVEGGAERKQRGPSIKSVSEDLHKNNPGSILGLYYSFLGYLKEVMSDRRGGNYQSNNLY